MTSSLRVCIRSAATGPVPTLKPPVSVRHRRCGSPTADNAAVRSARSAGARSGSLPRRRFVRARRSRTCWSRRDPVRACSMRSCPTYMSGSTPWTHRRASVDGRNHGVGLPGQRQDRAPLPAALSHQTDRASLDSDPPSVRQVTGMLTRRPDTLNEDERLELKTVLDGSRTLTVTAQQARGFAVMLIERHGDRLPGWMNDVQDTGRRARMRCGLTPATCATISTRSPPDSPSVPVPAAVEGVVNRNQDDQAPKLRTREIRPATQVNPRPRRRRDGCPVHAASNAGGQLAAVLVG